MDAGRHLPCGPLFGERDGSDRSARVRTFGASSRHVIDYLTAEVLEVHDLLTQSLMIRTSILERLCGPLCDAVMETKGSGAMLDALSRSNLFLVQLDDESDWYRFHHCSRSSCASSSSAAIRT